MKTSNNVINLVGTLKTICEPTSYTSGNATYSNQDIIISTVEQGWNGSTKEMSHRVKMTGNLILGIKKFKEGSAIELNGSIQSNPTKTGNIFTNLVGNEIQALKANGKPAKLKMTA